MAKVLLIFDFDNTIINRNTDSEIIKAQSLFGQCISAKNFFTNAVGWAESMSYTLKDLHNSGFNREKIDHVILDIPLTPGMLDVFRLLGTKKSDVDTIMLSHSNKYFIDLLLKKYDFGRCFDDIFTYDCEWIKEDGPLVVKAYDTLEVNCEICPPDFCKGLFVETYREQTEWKRSQPYKRVVYVGDGGADFCAALSLNETDAVLARKNYSLHDRILKDCGASFKGEFFSWTSGQEVAQYISLILDGISQN